MVFITPQQFPSFEEVNWHGNYSTYLTLFNWNKTYADTLYQPTGSYLTSESDPLAYNGTLAYNSSLANYYLASNPSNFISDGNTNWDNSYGFINWGEATNGTLALTSSLSNYATNVKVDSIGNWTLDKTSYSTTSQANALYYAINNPSGFYNSTDFSISNYVLISALDYYTDADIDGSESAFTGWDKDASDDLELSTILAFNYYNSTDFSISDYLTKALWNTNYTTNNDLWLEDTDTQLSDGDISAFGYIKDYTETDPYWLANYSNFLTISAWNDSV